ncbi:Peptidase C56 [uncultured Gammaproteobacteria bacterium]
MSMSYQPLAGKTVAFLIANGFEETEMTESQRALLNAGAQVRTISPEPGLVNGWLGKGWGHFFPIDRQIATVLGADYDMLVLPGGERSVAKLALNAHTRRIVSHFLDAGKPIAAIDDGIALLGIAPKLNGRTLAAPEALRPALAEAGANLAEETMMTDGPILTACGLDELDAFVAEMLRLFGEGSAVQNAA